LEYQVEVYLAAVCLLWKILWAKGSKIHEAMGSQIVEVRDSDVEKRGAASVMPFVVAVASSLGAVTMLGILAKMLVFVAAFCGSLDAVRLRPQVRIRRKSLLAKILGPLQLHVALFYLRPSPCLRPFPLCYLDCCYGCSQGDRL
jgi:hypothetical protein